MSFRREALGLIARAAKAEDGPLSRWPQLLGQQIANRLAWHALHHQATEVRAAIGRALEAWETRSPAWLRAVYPAPPDPLLERLEVTGTDPSPKGLLCLAVHPEETWIAAGDFDGRVHLWRRDGRGSRLRLDPHSGPVHSVAFSPDGRLLASAGADGQVAIFSAESSEFERIRSFRTDPVSACAFTDREGRLVTAGFEGEIVVWDVGGSRMLLDWRGHEGRVTSLRAFRSATLLSSGLDGKVVIWDAASGAHARSLDYGSQVMDCDFDPATERVATAGRDGRLVVWDARTGGRIWETTCEQPLLTCRFSPDGKAVAVGGESGRILICPVLEDETLREVHATGQWLVAVEFLEGGRTIASASTMSGAVALWAVEDIPASNGPTRHNGVVGGCAFDGSGRMGISGGWDGTLRVWPSREPRADISEGAEPSRAPGEIMGLDVSGGLVATAGKDGQLKLWRIQEAGGDVRLAYHQTLLAENVVLLCCALDAAGRRVAVGGMFTSAAIINLTSHAVLMLPGHSDSVLDCDFSPDGRSLATSCRDGHVRIWDAGSGTLRDQFRLDGSPVEACRFSRDGLSLGAATRGGQLGLWSAESGERTLHLEGHDAWVQGLDMCPCGRHLLSGGWDSSLRVWDLRTGGQELLLPTPAAATCCAWSAAHNLIMYGDAGGAVALLEPRGL